MSYCDYFCPSLLIPYFMEKVNVKDLGLIPYQEAWDLQQELLKEVIGIKRERRKTGGEAKHYFLFCEHPHAVSYTHLTLPTTPYV